MFYEDIWEWLLIGDRRVMKPLFGGKEHVKWAHELILRSRIHSTLVSI